MVKANKELWTVDEVAQFLGVHEMTIYRMAQKGRLPGFKVGTHWRFTKRAIEDWMVDQVQISRLKADARKGKAA